MVSWEMKNTWALKPTITRSKPSWDRCFYCTPIIEGSLEVKLPTIWTDEKQSRAEAERRERLEERRSAKRKSQKKEDADARKGRKVAKHCVFPMICGPGGSKSRLAKAAGAEPAGQMRDEQLHAVVARSTFRSKMYKTHHSRTTFGSWDVEKVHAVVARSTFRCIMHKAHHARTTFGSCDVEKVHAVVARSTFRSQNVQSTPCSDHFWKLRCRKSARRCGAKHISKSKHTMLGPLLEVAMSKKVTPLWREAHFEVKMYKTPHVRATFGGSDGVSRGMRKGLCTWSKVSKTWGFCSISKNDGRRGTFEEDLQRCILRGRRSTKDMFIRDVRRSGRWFPERGCILEHQICRFAKMILRDRCSTSHDLASIFRGRRSTLDRWSGKIAKRIGTRLSALHFTFHFSRKSRRIALFLMLSSSKIEEVSQNCFVLEVVKFKIDT